MSENGIRKKLTLTTFVTTVAISAGTVVVLTGDAFGLSGAVAAMARSGHSLALE